MILKFSCLEDTVQMQILFAQKAGKFPKFVFLIENTNIDSVSLGAVSFRLKTKNVQIPLFHAANPNYPNPLPQKDVGSSEKLEPQCKSSKKFEDEDEEDKKIKKCDFIAGIDLGTTFTGCSYVNLNDTQVNDIKTIRTIETSCPKSFGNEPRFQSVLTFPVMWTTSARETMAQAAIEATIIKKDERDDLLIDSEPEAAALFCEKKNTRALFGTITILMLIIISLFVMLADKQWTWDTGLEIKNTGTSFDSVTDDYVSNLKCNFKPDSANDRFCVVKLLTERRINDIPNTLEEKIFDPIISNILALIQEQLNQASENKNIINAILLVGGFSRNPYLQQRIQDEYGGDYAVKIPEEGFAANFKRAVFCGLKSCSISSKLVSQSIALEARTPFEKSEDGRLDKKVDGETTEEVYSKNRLEYFVRHSDDLRGDSLKLFHKAVILDYPNNAVIETIKLPEVEGIKKGDPIQFDVGLKLDHIGATVTIECHNRIINGKIIGMTNGNEISLKVACKCDLIVVKNKKSLVFFSKKNYSR
ncbi:hypothetical protein BDF21DRAFT_404027 [Thamnidium elegans]|nr:hypothetical protein BDF21DRAFT_404027 [Thamnidium elegans]